MQASRNLLLFAMRLGPKTSLFLDVLITSGIDALGMLTAPTSRLGQSGFWDSDEQFRKQLLRLEENGLVELDRSGERADWVVKLTARGLAARTDSIDPEARWNANWDGEWRLLSFDLPAAARKKRYDLREWLDLRRFGKLQGSVRIVAIFEESWRAELAGMEISPSSLLFFEGRPKYFNTNEDIVNEAWDFDLINGNYRKLIDFLETGPEDVSDPKSLESWLFEEARLWRDAFELDPFLPSELLSAEYLGKQAFAKRKRVLKEVCTPRT